MQSNLYQTQGGIGGDCSQEWQTGDVIISSPARCEYIILEFSVPNVLKSACSYKGIIPFVPGRGWMFWIPIYILSILMMLSNNCFFGCRTRREHERGEGVGAWVRSSRRGFGRGYVIGGVSGEREVGVKKAKFVGFIYRIVQQSSLFFAA